MLERPFTLIIISTISFLCSCNKADPNAYLSKIKSICFCGDSYTAGLFYDKENNKLGEIPSKGYAKLIADKYRLTLENHSISNAATGDYIALSNGLDATLNGPISDLYVIVLGINDYWKSLDLGSLDDLSSDDKKDNFYVNMYTIVNSIKNKSANSDIIIMKCIRPFDKEMYNFYSTAVEDIANYCGVLFGETINDQYLNSSSFEQGMNKDHPSIEQQGKLSQSIENIINSSFETREK